MRLPGAPAIGRCRTVLAVLLVAAGGVARGQDAPVAFDDASALLPFERQGVLEGGTGLGGAAWFDYDRDGWLDLLITNGHSHENALFHNNGDGTFTDVAKQTGVANGAGNTAVLAADLDNDGWQDLFLAGDDAETPESEIRIYYNNGDGTFSDITNRTGVIGVATSMGGSFGDINNDGYLDLFITGPHRDSDFTRFPNQLYLNNGDLTFTDVSAAAGVNTTLGACISLFHDYNDDGWIDLFVGECTAPNIPPKPVELFRNNGDLTFTEVAAAAGLRSGGFPMAFGPADFDNDGDVDIFVTDAGTAFALPSFHALYSSNCDETYSDIARTAGAQRLPWGWGCAAADFDNDGFADIFYTGSYPRGAFNVIGPGRGNPGILLMNNRDGTFANYAPTLPVNMENHFTSGVAHADYDNDGDIDILTVVDGYRSVSASPILYRNRGTANRSITLRLEGTIGNRDAVGARVAVTAGGVRQLKEVYSGTSYLSMDSQWLVFGLGEASATDEIVVRWPAGLVEAFANVAAGETAKLLEGSGTAGVAADRLKECARQSSPVATQPGAACAVALILLGSVVGAGCVAVRRRGVRRAVPRS